MNYPTLKSGCCSLYDDTFYQVAFKWNPRTKEYMPVNLQYLQANMFFYQNKNAVPAHSLQRQLEMDEHNCSEEIKQATSLSTLLLMNPLVKV